MQDIRLTVGMATYDDFDGVWFTVMALRMYHLPFVPGVEIVVIDNHPTSPQGQLVRDFLTGWVKEARYVPFAESVGTAASRNRLFAEARGDYVLCLDCHVLLEHDALRRLMQFYETQPACRDLLQGPLLYDDLQSISSHLDDVWREEMWGIWGTDPRAHVARQVTETVETATGHRQLRVDVTEEPPFEIPAQGLGLFACRKDGWLGFHAGFRGFGGEEFYIHEKYRQAGRRTLCLPFLRWAHRFGRPAGVPYRLTVDDKFRNYLLGLTELGLSVEPALEHFRDRLPEAAYRAIAAEVGVRLPK